MKYKLTKWETNVIGIDNINTSHLNNYYKFILKNHKKIRGDIVEAGVFKGKSLLATALMMKANKIDKKIFAFDTWSGFPKKYRTDSEDKIYNWTKLFKKRIITKKHYNSINKNLYTISYLKGINKKKINSYNLSTSGDFSQVKLSDLKKKAKFLKLDNIIFVKGSFENTMKKKIKNLDNIMCALVDVDLYRSYKVTLDFLWPKMSNKGMIYLDEYYSLKFPGARIACNEFCKINGVKPKLLSRDQDGFERYAIFKL